MTAVTGELQAGYDALRSGAACHRDGSRLVLRVEGARAPDMLQGLITADIRSPGEGTAWPTLILTPKGRILADAVVVRTAALTLLDVPVAAWPRLQEHFGQYLPPRFATLEATDLGVLRLRGPEAVPRATSALEEIAELSAPRHTEREGVSWAARRIDGGVAVRSDGPGGDGIDLYWPGDRALPLDAGGDGWTEAADGAWQAWRIEQGIAQYGSEITLDNLPQETGLVAASTSFTKGCYTGQEVLARIHYRGKVQRHLRGLRPIDSGEGAIPPEVGDELVADGRTVGVVTSVTATPATGWAGLGYVRREIEPESVLSARRADPAPETGIDVVVTNLARDS